MNLSQAFLFFVSSLCVLLSTWIIFKQVVCRFFDFLHDYDGVVWKLLFMAAPTVIVIADVMFMIANDAPGFARGDRMIVFLKIAGSIWAIVHVIWLPCLFIRRTDDARVWMPFFDWCHGCGKLIEGKPLHEDEEDAIRDWAIGGGAVSTAVVFVVQGLV